MAMNRRSEDMSWAFNARLTVCLSAAITGAVVLMRAAGLSSGSSFGYTLGIAGGVGGSLANFVIPGLLYRTGMPPAAPLHTLAAAEVVVGTAIMATVLVTTVVAIATSA